MSTKLEEIANKIQEAKHRDQLTTAECARDSKFDLEAYYRARAEGLQEAEKIVREYLPNDSFTQADEFTNARD